MANSVQSTKTEPVPSSKMNAERKKAYIFLSSAVILALLTIFLAHKIFMIPMSIYKNQAFIDPDAPLIDLNDFQKINISIITINFRTNLNEQELVMQELFKANLNTDSPIYLQKDSTDSRLYLWQARRQVVLYFIGTKTRLLNFPPYIDFIDVIDINDFFDVLSQHFQVIKGRQPLSEYSLYFTDALRTDAPIYIIDIQKVKSNSHWTLRIVQDRTLYGFSLPSWCDSEDILSMLREHFKVKELPIGSISLFIYLYKWSIYITFIILVTGGIAAFHTSRQFIRLIALARKNELEEQGQIFSINIEKYLPWIAYAGIGLFHLILDVIIYVNVGIIEFLNIAGTSVNYIVLKLLYVGIAIDLIYVGISGFLKCAGISKFIRQYDKSSLDRAGCQLLAIYAGLNWFGMLSFFSMRLNISDRFFLMFVFSIGALVFYYFLQKYPIEANVISANTSVKRIIIYTCLALYMLLWCIPSIITIYVNGDLGFLVSIMPLLILFISIMLTPVDISGFLKCIGITKVKGQCSKFWLEKVSHLLLVASMGFSFLLMILSSIMPLEFLNISDAASYSFVFGIGALVLLIISDDKNFNAMAKCIIYFGLGLFTIILWFILYVKKNTGFDYMSQITVEHFPGYFFVRYLLRYSLQMDDSLKFSDLHGFIYSTVQLLLLFVVIRLIFVSVSGFLKGFGILKNTKHYDRSLIDKAGVKLIAAYIVLNLLLMILSFTILIYYNNNGIFIDFVSKIGALALCIYLQNISDKSDTKNIDTTMEKI